MATKSSTPQLPLGIRLPEVATFDGFHPGPNEAALAAARALAEGTNAEPVVYLWGGPGTGKSHLLQAACRAASAAGRAVAYVPLRDHATLAPGALEGLETLGLVCIDDVDAIAGRHPWEEALVGLLNGLRDHGNPVLAAGAAPPAGLGVTLPDLRSRLAAGPVFALREPDDEDKLRALQVRAATRGLELTDEVGRYLLRRARRDMATLFGLLDRLDHASLAAKRRLTIPFVREVLGERRSPP